jgi:sugar phosphate isomerase/epimerase
MDRWQYCLDCFRIVARIAEDEGVILALQNHPPIVRNHRDCLAMVEEVNSPNFKISFDISGERAWQDTDWVLAAAERLDKVWVRSAWGGDFKRNPDGTASQIPLGRSLGPKDGNLSWNFDAWVQGMQAVGYEGYVLYEACTPTYLPNGNLVPIETIDQRVQMAHDFISQLITKHYGDES